MKPVSFVVRYYDQPLMLDYQLRALDRLPGALREMLHVVLVDDGSPRPARAVVDAHGVPNMGSFRVFRTLVDVPWNQEFATNLGVSQVETEWLLHLDIDHEVPASTLDNLVFPWSEHDPRTVYLFQRRWAVSLEKRTMAPGLWFLTKQVFEDAGGLEERFAGRYLPSDRDFMQRVERRANAGVSVLQDHLLLHDEAEIPDASALLGAPHVVGDEGEAFYYQVLAERGDGPCLRLSYPWERVL